MQNKPYLIDFPKIGDYDLGFISISEKSSLPFIPKRVYWTYCIPEKITRGNHAHFDLEQILVALAGKIELTIETKDREVFEFLLDGPNKGVFIPKFSWRTMKYESNSIQLCIASNVYDESDYIRDYQEFLKLIKK
jgi:hypothetical protein